MALLLINLKYCIGHNIACGNKHIMVAKITPATPKPNVFAINIDNGIFNNAVTSIEII